MDACKIETLCIGLKFISEIFDKDHLFIRDCYPRMLVRCLALGMSGCVCVSGDPGIGKSFFAFYVFLALYRMGQPVVLVHQSGSAFVYDGKSGQMKFMQDYREFDMDEENTWLLLDGHAEKRYLSKRKRGIVFASPKKSNYHEFVKQNGSVLFMPPWTLAEVLKFASNGGIQPKMQNLIECWYRREKGLNYIAEDSNESTETETLEGSSNNAAGTNGNTASI